MPKKESVKAESEKPKISLAKKLVTTDATWTKDEFLDGIYWVRQVLALIAGIVCGVARFEGFIVVTSVITGIFALSVLHFRSILGVDVEEFGGQSEGLFPAIALFGINWIIFYSIFK